MFVLFFKHLNLQYNLLISFDLQANHLILSQKKKEIQFS